MELIRNWLLPVLVAAQQLAVWPGRPLLSGDPVEARRLAVVLAVTVAVTAALGVRRRFPVAAALATEAALVAGLLAPDEIWVLYVLADAIALYSVAVRCPGRTAVLVAVALTGSVALRSVAVFDLRADIVGETLVTGAIHAAVVGLGHSRRRWLAARRAAAEEVARAEALRSTAAVTERHRLARELHDVSAHHLTSVVVAADAARRLADRRPELAADALRLAADSGRETVAALHRLVAAMQAPAADEGSGLEQRVAELAAGFVRLGQRVSLDIAPAAAPLTGPVAEAAFGIVREALTNALRYAPGAAVHVTVADRQGTLDVTVRDDGTEDTGGAGGTLVAARRLGSGRGTAGMRERAAALGGTLEAGPRADRPGWCVRARLPRTAAAARRQGAARPVPPGLPDVALVLAVAAVPVLAVLAERPALIAHACLPALAHALPLLWRRRAPWAVLVVGLVAGLVAPAALATGVLPAGVAWALVAGGGVTECVALHAVASFAGPARVTFPAIAVVAGGWSITAAVMALLDGTAAVEGDDGAFAVFLAYVLGALLLLPAAAVWGLGVFVRARREEALGRDDGALAAAVRAAVIEAYRERQRIAAELRGPVLGHAGRLVARAEKGDLDGVAEQARAGLAAMRDLLAALREEVSPSPSE
ncbi:sensor histidine kinase [Streptomyces sp. NPDC057116]|uniref:ATP-binding protein n=1 Tax=Streptomyces sp. NPDC057116 TaxID=3346023 RepID=UPI00362F5993